MLVGQSGSGKTNILTNSTLARIQAGHDIHIVDQKNELAQIFENHVKVYNPDQTLELIRRLTTAAEDRMAHFGQVARSLGEPIRDIWEYEEVTGKKLPIIWLVLEELALVTEEINQKELTKLFVAGRSSGVFVYAAVQNLKAETLSTTSSSNILNKVFVGSPNKIVMRTLFTTGIPKEVYAKANNILGPPGKGILYNGAKHNFEFVEFARVDRELLKSLMR